MPDAPNQVSSGQRRANWVALRTLRQLPKAVGETAGGEPVYEVRSVRLLLDSAASNFVRLAECSRCGRELAGAPVLTAADLDRPLRPMICSDCIRSAGVSTVWEAEGGQPAAERPAPAALAASQPDRAPAPAPAPAEAKQPVQLSVLEGHLRVVTDRVNELGWVARAHQTDVKERARREEETAAALRDELAALRASTSETGAQLRRLTGAVAELEQRWAEGPPAPADGAGAGLVQLRGEVAQLARLVEAQRGEVIGFVAAVGETQAATKELAAVQEALARTVATLGPSGVEELIGARLAETDAAPPADVDLSKVEELIATRLAEAQAQAPADIDLSKVEELIAARLAEAEGRLADVVVGQWGGLETAIESSVNAYMAGFVRATEELAGGQAVLAERMDVLADHLAETFGRLEGALDRLAGVEAALLQPPGPQADAAPTNVPAAGFLDSLDRQLEAAARRLAARSQAGASRGEP